MYEPTFESIRHAVFGVGMLRELIRKARSGSEHDHVGRALRHRLLTVVEDDTPELARLLTELITQARARLHEAGIEPTATEKPRARRLPKRERELTANIAVLCTYAAFALAYCRDTANALTAASEGLAWAGTIGDYRQMALLWLARANMHHVLQQYDLEEQTLRTSVATARESSNTETIVLALYSLTAMLIAHWRLDDADATNTEALAMVRGTHEARVRSYYAALLLNQGRIEMNRTHYAAGIQTLREALRWCGVGESPTIQASILTHLGSVYLRLQQYRQSIEYHHQMVHMAEAIRSSMVRSWAYFRLGEVHTQLKEWTNAEDMLRRAWETCAPDNKPLRLMIAGKQAATASALGNHERGIELCQWMLSECTAPEFTEQALLAHVTLGEINTRLGQLENAASHYEHAVAITQRAYPQRTPHYRVALAQALHRLGRTADVEALLLELAESESLNLAEQVVVARLRAAIAEERDDVRTALDMERQAIVLERELIERRAEQSLHNAQVLAETDLLEREAELERARRARLEHELAETVVELSDRKQLAKTIESRLSGALQQLGNNDPSVSLMLRDLLAEVHTRRGSATVPAPLGTIDEEFLARLRKRWPDLTRKQERLCGLLRTGLASKEIAALIGIEPDSLKAQRKRLRKRLGLAGEVNLEKVLAEV